MSISNIDKGEDFDIAEFLGTSDFHDFELLSPRSSQVGESSSICTYGAKSSSSEKQVLIKVSTTPNEEENAALEEEFRILNNLKHQMSAFAANASTTAMRNKRKSGSFVRRSSFNSKPLHPTVEENTLSVGGNPFPIVLEMRKVYGDQCVALVYERFGIQTLESVLSGSFTLTEDYVENPTVDPPQQLVNSSHSLAVPGSVLNPEASMASTSSQVVYYESTIPLDHTVAIFCQLADVIDWLHRSKVAVQNFSPASIIVKRLSGRVYPLAQLANFSLARRFEKLGQVQHILDYRYISPEQTERMDRITDYRTDMYSFGLTMWEALTGVHPFADKDMDELVYAHLTEKVKEAHKINPNIPIQLVQIMDKLLQKNPGDRYQLFSAVKHDLKEIWEKCASIRTEHSIASTSSIPDDILMNSFDKWTWNLGTKDFSPFLQFRAKTYGRKEQQTLIWDTYQKWFKTNVNERQGRVVVLSGDYGTGKSAFAEELCAKTSDKCYPISSRPTKLQEQAAYKSFRSIMEQFVALCLGENNEGLKQWETLLMNIGEHGLRVLHSLVPSISRVISCMDFTKKLGATISKNDLFKSVENFLSLFASPEHPLLICLGELTPEDENVEMLSYLLATPLASKCFFVFLLPSQKQQSSIGVLDSYMTQIHISPLSLAEVVDILDEILRPRLMEINSLATLLLQKSAGNLLFLKELVKHCEKQELINFDQNQLLWTWDLKKIESEVGLSGDVISLLRRQIESLPADLKNALATAACIGLEFDVRTLSRILNENVNHVNSILHAAVTKGYIQPIADIGVTSSTELSHSQKVISTGSIASHSGSMNTGIEVHRAYRFCHRRIKEHLRNYISKSDFEVKSLQIAQLIKSNKNNERLSNEEIFEILVHYENAGSLVVKDEDLLSYGQLLCDVGFQKGTTVDQHISNFEHASKIVEKVALNDSRKQALLTKLWTSLSTLYIRSGQLEKAEKLLKLIKLDESTSTDSQKNEWTSLMVQLLIAKNSLKDAFELGRNSKSSVGLLFQSSNLIEPAILLQELAHAIENLEEQFTKPAAELAKSQYAEDMIQNCIHICKSRGDYNTLAHFIMMGARFSIVEGVTENSSYYFASIIQFYMGSLFGHYDVAAAKSFGELAFVFMERSNLERKLATAEALLNGYTLFWSYSEAADKINSVMVSNLEEKRIGPVIECMALFHQLHFLPCGKTVGVIRDYDRKFRNNALIQKGDQHTWDVSYRCYEDFASGTPIVQYEPITTALGKFNYYAKLLQAFIYFFPNRGEICSRFEEVLSDYQSTWLYTDALLCSTLQKCDDYSQKAASLTDAEKKELVDSIDRNISLINTYTQAQHSGEHRFKLTLAKAEKERALGNVKEGVEKYEEALEGAQAVANILYMGWINELYANVWVACNAKRLSKTFLQSSLAYWEQYGSEGKAEDIATRYPEYFKRANGSSTSVRRFSASSNTAGGGRRVSTLRYPNPHSITPTEEPEQTLSFDQVQKQFSPSATASKGKPVDLDINTFLKVTNSITNEKDLDALVDKILQHLMSNTGATKAAILFSVKSNMELHRILTNTGTESFNASEPHHYVPMSLIHYTTRASEAQVHTEIAKDTAFSGDYYVEQYAPKSTICCPIKHQNQTTGAIYLENRNQTGVFTSARVALVKSLMASASIAIANAHLEKKNYELSQALKESGKVKEGGPANISTPMQKVLDSINKIKARFDSNDPIHKTLDSFLSTLTSDGLFSANLGEANDKDGKGIDQDVKNWVESSLLMTSKTPRAAKEDKDTLSRSSTVGILPPAPPVILEESIGQEDLPLHVTQTSRSINDVFSLDTEKVNAELELSNNPCFDCFKLHDLTEGRPLFHLGNHMLKKYKLNTEFKLNPQTVDMFLQRIESSYNKLPYHNSIHATDVLQSVELILLDNDEISKHLSPLEIFSVCIASAVHDLDHPGINNNFLVKIGHPLAQLYNDNAVLESHHVAKAFEIAFLPKMTIFETMTPDQYTQCRKMIIQIVLATDLAQHFQFISKFNGKVASSSLNMDDENDRLLVMEMAVKCGDLGNPAKSFDQAMKWTNLVMEEFFRQGDREKQMGYPVSKFMDRLDTNVSKCQIGFIDFLVTPLFNAWTSFSKTEFTKLCQENIENNRKQWHMIADTPNVLPGVSSTDYETLDDLINISIPPISFGKPVATNERRKSLRDNGRKFSVGKFATFSVSESDQIPERAKSFSTQSPLISIARQFDS